MPEIDILLAAYNGEKYIAEQIDSILKQTFQDFRLLIRDDGSTDNTPAIIEEYARKFPGKIEVVHDDVLCRNSAKNFMELLKHARADYVMFSDQDDVWLPYKIQVSLWHIKELERKNPDMPALVFSGLKVVDENLKSMDQCVLYSLKSTEYKKITNLLTANVAAGCTSIMNKAVYALSKGYIENMPFAHDSIFAALASLCGEIEHIPAAMILYRQHRHNVVGYTGAGGGKGFLGSWMKKILGIRSSSRGVKRKCSFLLENYSEVIPPEKLDELNRFIAFLNKPKIVKFFMLLFGKGCKLDEGLRRRTKFFLRLVLN